MGQQDTPGKTEEAETATGAVNSDWPGCRPTGPPHLHLQRQYGCAIELAFKRMKSTMGLGQLPKKSDASSRAWLHGKLFLALLVERILDAAESFSPRVAGGRGAAEPMAGGPVHVP